MSEMHSKNEHLPIHLLSTWEVGNERKLEDSLTVNLGSLESDFGNDVSFETCVHLVSQKNSSSPCELKVTVPSAHRNMKITQISIISEARVIELYGRCGEYLATVEASFIEECEEMPVYKAETRLSQPSTECLLKFVRTKRKLDMWLYGINIQLQKSDAPSQRDSTINFQIVNTILRESGHQLTEKADKCKKFLQLYSSTSDTNKPKISNKPDLQMLMKIFESKYLHKCNPFDNDTKNISRSKCITTGNEILTAVPANDGDLERVTEHTNIDSLVSQPLAQLNLMSDVQQHVEQCFRNLEDKLMTKLDEKMIELETRQNEKFDTIFSQLEKLHIMIGYRNSSVKSTHQGTK